MTDDLRTALTKAIDRADPPGGMRAGTPSVSVAVLRALLAAHPAPEMQAQAHICPTCHDDHTAHQRCTTAPASDTRREDVEALRGRHGAMTWEEDNYAAGWEHALDAVLAVLPAPPVVDAHEVWEQGYDRAEADRDGTGFWARGKRANPYIARGATHV